MNLPEDVGVTCHADFGEGTCGMIWRLWRHRKRFFLTCNVGGECGARKTCGDALSGTTFLSEPLSTNLYEILSPLQPESRSSSKTILSSEIEKVRHRNHGLEPSSLSKPNHVAKQA